MTADLRSTVDAARSTPSDPTHNLLARTSDHAHAVRVAAFARLRAGSPVSPAELAEDTGLPADASGAALAELVAAGAANVDERGRIVAAAGLSLVPAAHELFMDGARFWTWCAFDAVGIPAALRLDALARTRCGQCAEPIEVGIRRGTPQNGGAIVGWLPGQPCANVQDDFCPQANLFCSEIHLSRWRTSAVDPPGRTATLIELASHGSDVWSEMRTEPRQATGSDDKWK